MSARLALLAALCALCLAACDEPARQRAGRTALGRAEAVKQALPPEPKRGPFHVLLIVIDSLRADVEWMGYRRPNAPRLSELARRSVVYRRAYSISSTTARSMGPLLAGRYPSEMPRSGNFFTAWHPRNVFLGERLQQAGHLTFSLHSHAYFFPSSGMSQGFDETHVLPGTVLNDPDPKPSAERMTKQAKRMLAARLQAGSEQRVFGYIHYLDPHAPYLAHEDRPSFGDEPRDLYDQEVHYTDEWVGELVRFVDSESWGKHTVLIVTADHGECFGEHGQLKHGYELWEELVHVPLLIRVPGVAPRVIDLPRSHIDLGKTILELMGVPAGRSMRGQSLVGELWGDEPEPRPVVMDLPRDNLQDRRRAVIDGHFKLIARGDDERFLLYDLAEDPREKRDLARRGHRELARMKRLYARVSNQIGLEEVSGDVELAGAPAGRRW